MSVPFQPDERHEGAEMSEMPYEASKGAMADNIQRTGRASVYELFHSWARQTPDALAIETAGRAISYAQLDTRVRALANALHQRGLRRGDRLAILSENRPEYIETMLAAAALGVIVACQNWRLSVPELEHCVKLVTPKMVFVSPRHAALFAAAKAGVDDVLEIGEAYEELLASGGGESAGGAIPPVDVQGEDGIIIIYTSGTTGMPKGALVSHRAEIARMTVLRMDLRVDEEDHFVAWAPMFHMGSADQLLGSLMGGAAVICVDGFDCRAIVDAIRDHKLGWLLLMPGTIEPVVQMVLAEGTVPRGVKACGAMADLVPVKLVAELSGALRSPYLNSFGATETGLCPGSRRLLPPGVIPTSLSKRQSSLCELRIVDPDGNEVPDGQPGEISVRGPTLFSGYWNAPDTNARDFAGGWFRMGDMFRRNPDRTYDFVDRVKYMIKSGGENIYPAEIERVLLADARITDAVVVRKSDDRWGEVPVAFISTVATGITVDEVDVLCRASLAGYKRPREVRFVAFADFPRSTTGKILRHEVEKWL
jgi:acyl-CoA synthetase (AMP-forming)/AMP-acid ligase II